MKEQKIIMPKHEKIGGDSKPSPSVPGPRVGEAPGLSDPGYVLQYGTKEEIGELKKLRQKVELRRASRPQITYWICEGCKVRSRANADFKEEAEIERKPCFKCNSPLRSLPGDEKGYLREMTKKESEQFLKEEAEKDRRWNERMKRGRLFEVNQNRQKEGLLPLTMEQYLEQEKAAYAKAIRR